MQNMVIVNLFSSFVVVSLESESEEIISNDPERLCDPVVIISYI